MAVVLYPRSWGWWHLGVASASQFRKEGEKVLVSETQEQEQQGLWGQVVWVLVSAPILSGYVTLSNY